MKVNSISGLCLTKLDVLDGLETLKICVAYEDNEGQQGATSLGSEDYAQLVPVYEELPGWHESTVGANSLSDLPENARAYIKRIEDAVGAPVDILSTGPDRSETLILNDPFLEKPHD